METLTQKRLKELLHYDPETGVFRWRHAVAKNIRPWDKAGCSRKDGYSLIRINEVRYLSHRLAWLYVYGVFPSKGLDHIDRNPTNNRIENLREATQTENMQNASKRKDNTSGFVGVSYDKRYDKWRARITLGGKEKFLGSFNTPEDAHEAYTQAKTRYHSFQPTLME